MKASLKEIETMVEPNTGREGGAMTDSKVVKASVTWSNNGWTCWFNGQRVLSMVV